jgi:hypothetical protein
MVTLAILSDLVFFYKMAFFASAKPEHEKTILQQFKSKHL